MIDLIAENSQEQVVEIRASGIVSRSDLEKAAEVLIAFRKSKGIQKGILDVKNVMNAPSAFDIFAGFTALPEDVRLALIYEHGSALTELVSFSVLTSLRNNENVRAFCSTQMALGWLHESA